MAQQYTVKPGDTVSAIAKRFGVTPAQVQGFRSNDPNVIFPDEVLTIQDAPQATQAPVTPPQAPRS